MPRPLRERNIRNPTKIKNNDATPVGAADAGFLLLSFLEMSWGAFHCILYGEVIGRDESRAQGVIT